MMSEKRFIFATNEKWFLFDNETEEYMDMEDCKDLLNEQQATIEQLQDLCGKSDGENAKLRIENKKLRKELSDCEKFRYQVFKEMEKINELKAKLKEKEEDERLYANEILELRKTNEEWLQFKDLGGDY